MNSLISLFIDNELSLEEKCSFVEKIHTDTPFFQESIDLLHQEILIQSDVVERVPRIVLQPRSNWMLRLKDLLRPAVLIPTAVACILLVLTLQPSDPVRQQHLNRFVIYRPDVSRVEITGSFTGWKRVPMIKVGTSGYWEGIFNLPEGEHRYTYILEGNESVADPTIPTMEEDDFGGMNSIIRVVNHI